MKNVLQRFTHISFFILMILITCIYALLTSWFVIHFWRNNPLTVFRLYDWVNERLAFLVAINSHLRRFRTKAIIWYIPDIFASSVPNTFDLCLLLYVLSGLRRKQKLFLFCFIVMPWSWLIGTVPRMRVHFSSKWLLFSCNNKPNVRRNIEPYLGSLKLIT